MCTVIHVIIEQLHPAFQLFLILDVKPITGSVYLLLGLN